jgi:mono/diheme cytochrome c family protein
MKRALVLSLGVVVAAITVFAIYSRLTDGRGADPDDRPIAAPPSDQAFDSVVARGLYLARAADCAGCHTAPEGKPYAGGVPFKLSFGTLYSTNITPEIETGIGSWTDDDFLRAVRSGVGRGGKHLYPAFPYTSYTGLSRDDVLAIKAYLFSLPAVRAAVPANKLSFPFDQRWGITFWNAIYFRNSRFHPQSERTLQWNRGAYLASALGHCGECHTPRNALYGIDHSRELGGAITQGWKAYDISSKPADGIGRWTNEQVVEYLSTGHEGDHGWAAGPMAEVVSNSLQYLSRADLTALVTYLRGDSPPAEPAASSKLPPSATGSVESASNGLGANLYSGACMGCHPLNASGAPSYAGVLGGADVRDPSARNITQILLSGSMLQVGGATMSMPAFAPAYSDTEIAAIDRYVVAKFGSVEANVTPASVRGQRRSGQ